MSQAHVRFAAPHELEPALRVLLASERRFADASVARQFIVDAQHRNLPLDRLRVAVDRSHIVWATLGLISPGRSGVVVQPGRAMSRSDNAALIARTVRETCDDLRSQGAQLIQVLLDPNDAIGQALHVECGFETLAHLEYLRLPARPGIVDFAPLIRRAAPEAADLAIALRDSYVDTLDCPRLNGLRTMEDVIAGYRHAHPYDPQLWNVLYDGKSPVGVLLMSRPGPNEAMEISYLGLAPAVRGKGLGLRLVQFAQTAAAAAGGEELAVAVDASNTPAKRIYFRAGGRLVLTRRVMIRTFGQPPGSPNLPGLPNA